MYRPIIAGLRREVNLKFLEEQREKSGNLSLFLEYAYPQL